jgi:hypothetical protein
MKLYIYKKKNIDMYTWRGWLRRLVLKKAQALINRWRTSSFEEKKITRLF